MSSQKNMRSKAQNVSVSSYDTMDQGWGSFLWMIFAPYIIGFLFLLIVKVIFGAAISDAFISIYDSCIKMVNSNLSFIEGEQFYFGSAIYFAGKSLGVLVVLYNIYRSNYYIDRYILALTYYRLIFNIAYFFVLIKYPYDITVTDEFVGIFFFVSLTIIFLWSNYKTPVGFVGKKYKEQNYTFYASYILYGVIAASFFLHFILNIETAMLPGYFYELFCFT